ncbi:MAG TPA: hypothetical protein DIU18_06760 [Gemmatimonadetes bacterium]|nr:hypothetical protein [Gemmatimonadota bacterium]
MISPHSRALVPTVLSRRLALSGLVVLLCAAAPPVRQVVSPAVQPRDTLDPAVSPQIFLVTIGPGEQVWERFGHNAIWVRDPNAGTDVAYNWGMFSFDQEGFLLRLLRGTMLYWMAPSPIEQMTESYVAANRSIGVQELALTADQKVELQRTLALNARPENAYYRYDYYRDNCSTRVRDALDRVLDGRVRAALEGVPTGATYRFHTLRLLEGMPLMYAGIQVVLSRKADLEIDRWEEGFIPVKLMEALRDVWVPDGSGGETPLVITEHELYRSTGPPEPTTVPGQVLGYLVLGVSIAVALLLLSARPNGWARVSLVLVAGGWSLIAGTVGVVLLGAWLFTDHVFWYPNANVLLFNPFLLVLGVLVLPLLVRAEPLRWAVTMGVIVAGMSLLGVAVKVFSGVDQQNGEILALTLPPNLALLGALLRLRASARATSPP